MDKADETEYSEKYANENSLLTLRKTAKTEIQDPCDQVIDLEVIDDINENSDINVLTTDSLHSSFPNEAGKTEKNTLREESEGEGSVQPSIDITSEKDGGVMKQILKEGTGKETPGFGDKVFVHYIGWLLNGKNTTMFDNSRERGEKFEFFLGKGLVIRAWDLGVATMTKGEVSVFICQPKYAYGEFGSPPAIPPMSTLAFEIELFDWKLEDLSSKKDGGILREVIVKGEGSNSPNEGANVTAQITGYYCDDIFDDRIVEFLLGEGCNEGVPEGIEVALQKFKNQEKSKLYLTSKYAFGSSGKPEHGIPADSDVVYEVTLLKFEKAKEVWEMDTDEKLQESLEAKEKGSYYFKTGNIKVALKQFKRIVKYLEKEPGVSPEEQKPRSNLLLAGYLNSALCLLKVENPVEAVKICEKALEIDPENEKALFRRGQGLLALNEFEQALGDFQKTLDLYPSNKAAENAVIFSQKKIQRYKQKERKTYNNMFKKFADEDEELRKQMLYQTETGVWESDSADRCNLGELEEMNERNKCEGEGYGEIELLNDRNLHEIEMLNIHSSHEVGILNEHNKREMHNKIEVLNEHNLQELEEISDHVERVRRNEIEVMNERNKHNLEAMFAYNNCAREEIKKCSDHHGNNELLIEHNEHEREPSGFKFLNEHNICRLNEMNKFNEYEGPNNSDKFSDFEGVNAPGEYEKHCASAVQKGGQLEPNESNKLEFKMQGELELADFEKEKKTIEHGRVEHIVCTDPEESNELDSCKEYHEFFV